MNSNKSEMELLHTIQVELSHKGFRAFRANVGKVKLADGRWFSTGLPKGFSDLFAVKDGRIFFLEVKVKPNKPTIEQLQFLEIMQDKYGCKGNVVYSVADAFKVCGIEI